MLAFVAEDYRRRCPLPRDAVRFVAMQLAVWISRLTYYGSSAIFVRGVYWLSSGLRNNHRNYALSLESTYKERG
jgi:hypothetical protein